MRFLAALLAIICLSKNSYSQSSFITKLPAEGVAAVYEYKSYDPARPPNRAYKGTLTIKNLASKKIDGESYRWIEIELHRINDELPSDMTFIHKLLVPANSISKGENFAKKSKVAWLHVSSKVNGNSMTRLVPEPQELFSYLFAPKKAKQKIIDKKTFETKIGKLVTKGKVRNFETTRFEPKSGVDFVYEHEQTVYTNDQSPFGGVALKSVTTRDRIKSVVELKLKSVRQNAKTGLPKHWMPPKKSD